MGADINTKRFHIYYNKYYFRVILFEYPKDEYLWIYAWLRKSKRGTGEYIELKKEIFKRTPGAHHIHFFPGMKTVKALGRNMGWLYFGKSYLYYGCNEYRHIVNGGGLSETNLEMDHAIIYDISRIAPIANTLGLGGIIETYCQERDNDLLADE